MVHKLKYWFLGDPLATKAISRERYTNSQGLAIFGADPLSSTAYATEEILLVLAAVGAIASNISLPISLAIVVLILLVAISYRQVILAYPQGGGVYNVARENLGEFPALLGAASLLTDYILTVAVSVAAAVAALTSAFETLQSHRVMIGIGLITFLAWGNLRGVKESGKWFSLPTHAFIIVFLGMIGYGIWRYLNGTFPIVAYDGAVTLETSGALGLFLILRASASGCTALTGIEAASNGVQAFHKPEAQNASKTMLRMALLLGSIFLGITFLASWAQVQPVESETVISQIARALFGSSVPYFLVQAVTVVILLFAANTPFAGFPRVASQLARDGYFPHQFLNLGSRLVFANGILVLAVMSAFLFLVFGGGVHALIPLYAVGVFLGFSLSQLGMVRHWIKIGGHKKNIAINAIGCLATTVVFLIVFTTKFVHGAWFLIPAIGCLVIFMLKVSRHYEEVKRMLALDRSVIPRIEPDKTMVVLVSAVNRATLYTMQHVKSFRPAHLMAFHVAIEEAEAAEIKRQWTRYLPDVPLTVVVSEYRDFISPTLDFLKEMQDKWQGDTVIVVMSEFIPDKPWYRLLHNQLAARLRYAIEKDPDINAEILELPVKTSTPLRADD